MRILITGGFGYLGSILAVHLSNIGCEVIIGTSRKVSSAKWLKNSKILNIDWLDQENMIEKIKDVDQIIHAAGMNSQDCNLNPKKAMQFNGEITGKLALAALKANIKKFIFLSTVHIYSPNLIGYFNEKSIPNNNSPYAKSKLKGEEELQKILRNSNTQFLILRLSNLIGEPIHKEVNIWNLLQNSICKDIINNKDIFLKNPYQLRDFLSVRDLKEFFTKSLRYEFKENIFNICSGESFTVKEFAEIFNSISKKLYGYEVKIKYEKLNFNEEKNFLKIESSLPFSIKNHDLVEDIENLFQFCKTNF